MRSRIRVPHLRLSGNFQEDENDDQEQPICCKHSMHIVINPFVPHEASLSLQLL